MSSTTRCRHCTGLCAGAVTRCHHCGNWIRKQDYYSTPSHTAAASSPSGHADHAVSSGDLAASMAAHG